MKKQYIQPTVKIHSVRPHSMLASSLTGGGGDTANGALDPNNSGDGGNDVLGKEDFGW